MKISFLWLGKCKDKEYITIINQYSQRLKHYVTHDVNSVKDPKSSAKNKQEIIKKEAAAVLSKLEKSDYVVLLDERGKHLNSKELADWVQHKLNISIARIVFVIAGAYGAHQTLKERADYTLSLSHMTLTHDMARIFILEQVYRAFTIIKGEKYHNP